MEKAHHIIYKTTCIITNKVYIGMHSTDDINDGYLGSGKYLKLDIKKYGSSNFIRIILHECSSLEELFYKEKEIVTPDFCIRLDNYNIREGGMTNEWYKNCYKPRSKESIEKHSKSMIGKNLGRKLSLLLNSKALLPKLFIMPMAPTLS